MNSRNGKIARLPHSIRLELNQRLHDAEPGPQLLAWLNDLPQVREILEDHFDGSSVTRQNLSEWRQGGFQEWLLRQDFLNDCQALQHLAEDLDEPDSLALVADHAATVLAARIGALLTRWNGQVDDKFEARVRALNTLARSVVQLQRGMRRSSLDALAVERAVHDRDQRDLDSKKQKLIDPFFNALKVRPLAETFGGGPTGKKVASYIAAVLNGNLQAEIEPPDPVQETPAGARPLKSKTASPPKPAPKTDTAHSHSSPTASDPVQPNQTSFSTLQTDPPAKISPDPASRSAVASGGGGLQCPS